MRTAKTPALISRLRRTLSQRPPNGIESHHTAHNFAPRSTYLVGMHRPRRPIVAEARSRK